ncbi:MAG: Lrp/AsnC family transcriptional regulator [Nanoarchaeota archaeon]|nr:Lrp/AsnC family transcriptional regulator [Nanoarchaeota archaeon]
MKFTPKDKLILFELFQDARQSNFKIAKELKIPEKTVNHRIKEMIKSGIIKKFSININYQKLGYNRHSIYLDLKKTHVKRVDDKIKKILKIPEISCCYYLHEISEWKLYVSIWTKTIGEYDDIQTKILSILKEDVINYVSFQSVRSYTYLSRLLNPKKKARCDVKEGLDCITLSNDEKKLIDILREDSRKPLLEISKSLGVHTDTVKRKLKKLKDSEIIQRFYPLVDLSKIDVKEYTFICRLNSAEDEKIQSFIKWARGNPHFVVIIKAVGWVNLYYAFQVRNNEEFKKIRSEIQKMIGDITLKEFRIEVEDIMK